MELRKRKKIETVPDSSSSDESDGASPPSVVKTPKRRRISRMKGKLQDLPDFAVEIQLEVFGYLEPRDLFNLSRTCKVFRNFFWTRNNERLWKDSIARSRLPQRPPFLSIPAFVHLLYAPYCHGCGSSNIRNITWRWFARYCQECVKSRAVELSMIVYEFSDHNMRSRIRDIGHSSLHYIFNIAEVPWEWISGCVAILKSDISEFEQQYRSEGVSWEKFVVIRATKVRERQKIAQKGQAWSDEQVKQRQTELNQGKHARVEEIIGRLEKEGWGKDIDFLGRDKFRQRLSTLPGARQSTKLTNHGWPKVRERIEPFLAETRNARLFEEHETVLRPRFFELEAAVASHYVQLPKTENMDLRPHFIDFALMPECRALIDVPADELVTAADLSVMIPELGAQWMAARKEEICAALEQQLGQTQDNIFELATAAFFCTGDCSRALLRYPEILAHGCTRKTRKSIARKVFDQDHDEYAFAASMHKTDDSVKQRTWDSRWDGTCAPFSLACVTKDEKAVTKATRALRAIVAAMGLDPDRATLAELQACEKRLLCLTCKRKGGDNAKYAYGWEAAFKHSITETTTRSGGKSGGHEAWATVRSPRDTERAVQLEVAEKATLDTRQGNDARLVWSCSLCAEWSSKWEALSSHLSEEHQLPAATLEERVSAGTVYLNHGLSKHGGSGVFYAPRINMNKHL